MTLHKWLGIHVIPRLVCLAVETATVFCSDHLKPRQPTPGLCGLLFRYSAAGREKRECWLELKSYGIHVYTRTH